MSKKTQIQFKDRDRASCKIKGKVVKGDIKEEFYGGLQHFRFTSDNGKHDFLTTSAFAIEDVKNLKPIKRTKKELKEMEDSMYCPVCGGCGFIGCCGVKEFLEKHVRGKTDCRNEGLFIDEIIELWEQNKPDLRDYFELLKNK